MASEIQYDAIAGDLILALDHYAAKLEEISNSLESVDWHGKMNPILKEDIKRLRQSIPEVLEAITASKKEKNLAEFLSKPDHAVPICDALDLYAKDLELVREGFYEKIGIKPKLPELESEIREIKRIREFVCGSKDAT